MREPVAISVALGGVLATAVALAALLVPGLTLELQAAIIAFGNAAILFASIMWARRRSTPTAAPVLPIGTPVSTPGTDPSIPNAVVREVVQPMQDPAIP